MFVKQVQQSSSFLSPSVDDFHVSEDNMQQLLYLTSNKWQECTKNNIYVP